MKTTDDTKLSEDEIEPLVEDISISENEFLEEEAIKENKQLHELDAIAVKTSTSELAIYILF